LFVWVCLHAGRNSGRLPLVVANLARSLHKPEPEIDLCLQELVGAGVCRVVASGSIEIQDTFWPYRRDLREANSGDTEAYVAAIRRLFLRHRGVPVERAERAIYLGVARKYAALLNNRKGSPITTLSYFENLLAEVGRANVSPDYWQHVRKRAEQFERRWRSLSAAAHSASGPSVETK
jgi:hypothetical protein